MPNVEEERIKLCVEKLFQNWTGFFEQNKFHGIGKYQGPASIDTDSDLRNMDISRELRLLGYPESEINRWALIKKIEQRTGKPCDDYV